MRNSFAFSKPHAISLLLPHLRGDGAVRMMMTLAAGFHADGYRVDLLVANSRGAYSKAIPNGIRLIDLHEKTPTRALFGLVRYLRRERPSVLMASEHYSGLPALYALKLSRLHAHCVIRQDNTWGMDSARFKGLQRIITPRMVPRVFRAADIIAVSHGVARDLISHFPHLRNNTSVIYNPVISPDLIAKSRAPLDHPWFRPSEPPVCVAIGRLAHAKGFDLLIEAFARVVGQVAARLLILGEGPERTRLEAQIASLQMEGVCRLEGYCPNPYPFLHNANVFVLSSRFEGLPTVLIEALAVGAPVIATDCPSGPREILADGRYGTLVAPEDPEQLATAILEHLRHPAPAASDLGDWLHQFDVDASVRKHIELIEAVMANPPPNVRNAPLPLHSAAAPR
ncbi:MAG TPA: glycosyltransferase [Rhodanobacteraceae bacterium]|nr:glycosyltransferase [Rhodanobacteraceae bacterium]